MFCFVVFLNIYIHGLLLTRSASSFPQELTTSDKETILDTINNFRALVAKGVVMAKDGKYLPPGYSINRLMWDPCLEDVATNHSIGCNTNANADRDFTVSTCSVTIRKWKWNPSVTNINVGETRGEVFINGGAISNIDGILTIINDWIDQLYDYAFGQYCDYTIPDPCEFHEIEEYDKCDYVCSAAVQLLWGNTRYIGCGFNHCGDNQEYGILVCNFYPSGNIKAEWPYKTTEDKSAKEDECPECDGDRECNDDYLCGGGMNKDYLNDNSKTSRDDCKDGTGIHNDPDSGRTVGDCSVP